MSAGTLAVSIALHGAVLVAALGPSEAPHRARTPERPVLVEVIDAEAVEEAELTELPASPAARPLVPSIAADLVAEPVAGPATEPTEEAGAVTQDTIEETAAEEDDAATVEDGDVETEVAVAGNVEEERERLYPEAVPTGVEDTTEDVIEEPVAEFKPFESLSPAPPLPPPPLEPPPPMESAEEESPINLFPSEDALKELARRYEENPVKEKTKTLTLNSSDLRYSRYLLDMKRRIELYWEYPLASVKRGEQGKLKITFIIKNDGTVVGIDVNGSPYPGLNDAALTAIRLAAPFSALPEDLATEELRINATFIYSIITARGRPM